MVFTLFILHAMDARQFLQQVERILHEEIM
jgi:hypothetical protein